MRDGGDGVGGVDRQPCGGVTAQMAEVGEVDPGDATFTGHRRQLGVVDGLVDDDVDHRLGTFGVGQRGGGSGEDGGDGVGAALAVAAFEQVGAGVVAEAGAQVVPFGVELGLRESLQHFGDGGALGGAEAAFEVHLVTNGDGSCGAGSVGAVVVAVGAVGVGELFPLTGGCLEHFERVGRGQLDEPVDAGGELVAAARVGVQPGQLADLVDTEAAGGQRVGAGREVAYEFGGADTVGDGHVGDTERSFDPAAHRDMAVVTEHLTAVGLGDDRHSNGFQLADRALHIPQPPSQLTAVEHTDVLAEQSDREIDRAAVETVTPSRLRTDRPTHTTIIDEGCHSDCAPLRLMAR